MSPVLEGDSSITRTIAHALTSVWNRGGWIGVDLFFVLSGFLISGLLFKEYKIFGAISAKNFLVRRGLKIYPAFWILIVITALVRLAGNDLYVRPLCAELLFVQNYLPGFWGHTWSLAVEEHFYILLLLYLLFLSKRYESRPYRHVPIAFVVIAGLSLALRLTTLRWLPSPSHYIYLFPTHLRLDSLAFGVLISYFYCFHEARFRALSIRFSSMASLVGITLTAPAFVFPLEEYSFIHTYGFTFFYLGSGLLLFSLLTREPGTNPVFKALAYVGSHSYSIYLWHLPIADWLVPWAKRACSAIWSWPLYFCIYFMGALAVGIVMSKLIEIPVLRLRDYYFPSRSVKQRA